MIVATPHIHRSLAIHNLPVSHKAKQGARHRACKHVPYAAPAAVSTQQRRAEELLEHNSNNDRPQAPAVPDSAEMPSTSGRQQHIAVLKARKSAAISLREGQRPLGVPICPISSNALLVADTFMSHASERTGALKVSHVLAGEYMQLPASQYSVLDAKQIERIDDDTFRCYVSGLRLFNLVVEPVLTVSVIVTERGPTVKLLSTEACSCFSCV